MMYHDLPHASSFWPFLLTIDQDLAETARKQECSCGGRLHRANYLRKPRGTLAQLSEAQCLRLSFCCDRDGCRKRLTPPSVRFLGRKVYLGAVIILISAMRQGPTPRRVRELSTRYGVDERTIARWQVFWREHFPQTHFWKVARARLAPLTRTDVLPSALVDAFLLRTRADCDGWSRLLRFLAPMTVSGGLSIEISR
jgi:hypothetical protein